MSTKLIFLDIDGTLTPAGSNEPPASALAAIRSAQAAGNKVFLCTGRNLDMLSPLLKYGFDGVIASAGGYVTLGEQVLFDCPMDPAIQKTAMELLAREGVFRTIEAKDATYGDENLSSFLEQAGDGNSELIRWRKALAEQLNIQPMDRYDGRPIYKIVYMCQTREQLQPAIDAVGHELNFVIQALSDHNCLNGELINRRFDKGTGVRLIAETLGVPIEETYGFGDSMNDLEMIQTVGVSVCMDNGNPQLKAISSLVCPAVEHDGLAWAFEKLGLTRA